MICFPLVRHRLSRPDNRNLRVEIDVAENSNKWLLKRFRRFCLFLFVIFTLAFIFVCVFLDTKGLENSKSMHRFNIVLIFLHEWLSSQLASSLCATWAHFIVMHNLFANSMPHENATLIYAKSKQNRKKKDETHWVFFLK